MGRCIVLLFTTLLVQVAYSQTLIQQSYQPQIPTNNVLQQAATQLAPNVIGDYSMELCKNLANQVQSLVLTKLTRSACKKPIFNQIAGPLLNEIALRVQGTQCPVCGNVPIPSAVNSIANIPIQSAINSLASFPVQYPVQGFGNPLQGLGNFPAQTLVNSLGNLPYPLVNQLQSLSPQMIQRLAVQNVPRQVVSQNPVLTPVQQRYSDALSLVNTLGGASLVNSLGGSNCGCGQRNIFGLY